MITVEQLCVEVGSFALRDVSFELEGGQYAILMGRTGSGKTTLLESICGLKPVTSGRILINGRDVTGMKPGARGIGFVPQDGALFTSMTVRDQVGFALAVRRWSRDDIERRVDELARLLGLCDLLDRGPQGLSGGEQQRVALGRALAARPSVLCLDEPLSALDESSRDGMYDLLKSVASQAGVTTLHITHSRHEAKMLGDCVFEMDEGQMSRVEGDGGTPERGDPETGPTC